MKTIIIPMVVASTILGLSYTVWNQEHRIEKLDASLNSGRIEYEARQGECVRNFLGKIETVDEGQSAAIRLLESDNAELRSKIEKLSLQIWTMSQSMKREPQASVRPDPTLSDMEEDRKKRVMELRFVSIEGELRKIKSDKIDSE